MRSFFDDYPLNSGRLAAPPAFSDYVENVRMAADELVRIPVPAGARYALFSFDANFRVKPGTAASPLPAPDATTSDGSGSEMNPVVRRIPTLLADGVTAVTHLCLRAATAASGSISFYA